MSILVWSQSAQHRFWYWHLVYWFGYLLLKYTNLAVLLPLQNEQSWPYLGTYTLLTLINLVITGYLGQRDLTSTMALPQQMRRLLYWIVPLCLVLLLLRQTLITTYSTNSSAWKSSFAEQMVSTLPLVLLPLLGWLAMYLLIKANQGYQQEFMAQQALLNQARAARLKVLRYQLNPHFMFNTLNALNSLIISRQGLLAEQLIQNLSTFLRHSLKNKDETLIPLPQELDALAAYLAIQQVRFGERLQLNWHIAALPKLQIPPLLLQPLAENAVLFTVAEISGPVQLDIRIYTTGLQLLIEIKRDIGNSDPAAAEPTTASAAANPDTTAWPASLQQLAERLELMFGAHASLQLHLSGASFAGQLSLPLESAYVRN
ncbi:transcriptional regulator [Rheinheimera riviphila]|uniref:Transcriptional regulator n=1 Tax=Rheinheimera riviphila TaxID=1834037 RepID=A0A437QMG1_9GAMM|nr:histidine kinase [Rheinheimera riviphila]RVU35672.1 transcriptional regulator [Rheinheimera riviphila]